jgi:hypothetical protein
MCQTVLVSTKVKIVKANMRTYWYAGKIDEEFWVTKKDDTTYQVIDNIAGRWIDVDDCEIVRTGKIKVTTTVEELE